MSEIDKKLEAVKQDLAVAKSALQVKNTECAALQQNLQELEELREMKQVDIISLFFFASLFSNMVYVLLYYFHRSNEACSTD